jgi:ABC-type multidrug transport system ATPase subunit
VLLLDEPETGLDAAAFGLLGEMATAEARTVVLTTHNLSAGLQLGTRTAILARGQLVYEQAHLSSADAAALTARLEELAR